MKTLNYEFSISPFRKDAYCEKNAILNAVSVTFHDFVTFYPFFFLDFQTCCETAYDDGWKILQVPIAYI